METLMSLYKQCGCHQMEDDTFNRLINFFKKKIFLFISFVQDLFLLITGWIVEENFKPLSGEKDSGVHPVVLQMDKVLVWRVCFVEKLCIKLKHLNKL